MDNIIYKSNNIIPWDTQSAFKMTNYTGDCDDDLIYCYFKSYVHCQKLIVCTYTFVENPIGDNDLIIIFSNNNHIIKVYFGYEGIHSITLDDKQINKDSVNLTVFKSNDEQGFYWCGEITFDDDFITYAFTSSLNDGDVIGLNLVQNFKSGNIGAVYYDKNRKENTVGDFIISEY